MAPPDEDPIKSNPDPPGWFTTLIGVLADIARGLGDLKEPIEKVAKGLGFVCFVIALGLKAAGLQVPNLFEEKPPPTVQKFADAKPSPPEDRIPFDVPGTAYGGDTGPVTSTRYLGEQALKDAAKVPKSAAAKMTPRLSSHTEQQISNSAESASQSPPHNVQWFLHRLCPWFIAAPTEVAGT
ncbi:hypothetical protein RLW55_16775 [Hyphomicrobium sp. B1]|uniref:hypothetical protein n=1 Tax=Hyphomicrobium sp. B1 TaxID=3075651 RepID=UPI003C2AFC02